MWEWWVSWMRDWDLVMEAFAEGGVCVALHDSVGTRKVRCAKDMGSTDDSHQGVNHMEHCFQRSWECD